MKGLFTSEHTSKEQIIVAEADDAIDGDLFADGDPTHRVKGALAAVVVFAGATGGAGTTTAALTAAELSASAAQIPRPVLVDGVLTRSDVRRWLRVPDSVVSMDTAAAFEDPRQALVPAGALNAARSSKVPDVGFAAILTSGATVGAADPVPTSTALRCVEAVRQVADLVIVDAGVLDLHPDRLAFKLVTGGAWLVLAVPATHLGASNAIGLLSGLTADGRVNRDRVMTLLSRRDGKLAPDATVEALTGRLRPYSVPVGVVPEDGDGIGAPASTGAIPTPHRDLAPAVAQALGRATGRDGFAAVADVATTDQAEEGRPGLVRRLRARTAER